MRVSNKQAATNRERVVEVASALFREKGFDGIGVADLMKSAGMTHGGFYRQFASKDQLAAEAMADAFDKAVERWGRRAERAPNASFEAVVRPYLAQEHRTAPAKGCPAAALGCDAARQTGPVRKIYTDGVKALVDVLAQTIVAKDEAERRQKALAAFSAMTGALMLARAVDDENLSAELLESMKCHLGLEE
ncbi:TetR/AcrR family transcriptional regulator [Corticibacterium sp. UT-5YL-CI-8]|nr:TetR/AcrR family transcriptional regulator [Tianweitania sp. UT-5YL-CI-8]